MSMKPITEEWSHARTGNLWETGWAPQECCRHTKLCGTAWMEKLGAVFPLCFPRDFRNPHSHQRKSCPRNAYSESVKPANMLKRWLVQELLSSVAGS